MSQKENSITPTQAILNGKEEERERIAKDLHDSLAQELSVIHMRLELVTFERKLDNVGKEIKEIQNMISDALISIKEISLNLSPRIIVSAKLSESLKKLTNKYKGYSYPEVHYTCTENFGLTSKKDELNVFRIVQEFIQNSVKHSNAKRIEVKLSKKGEAVELHLSDDGMGFDMNSIKETGGISNIIFRLESIEATYDFQSSLKLGTTLKLSIYERCS